MFAFSRDILGPILDDCAGIRVPPLAVLVAHNQAIEVWDNIAFVGAVSRISLRALALHVRVMMFAPYTTAFIASSQDRETKDYALDAHEVDRIVVQAADEILDLIKELRDTPVAPSAFTWAPFHVLAASIGGFVKSTQYDDNKRAIYRADSLLKECLKRYPAAERIRREILLSFG